MQGHQDLFRVHHISLQLQAWVYPATIQCLSVFSGLQSLNLNGTSVDDDSLVVLGDRCPQLHTLLLKARLPNLISDAGLQAVASGCKSLEVIDVSGQARVGWGALAAFADHSKQLQTLRLARSHFVTADGVERLLQRCPELRKLCVVGCRRARTKNRKMQQLVADFPQCEITIQ